MYIIAIAWIYVVLMMSITEQSFIAGVMTFLLYGVFPLAIILYLMGVPERKRRRLRAEKSSSLQTDCVSKHAESSTTQTKSE